MSAVDGCADCRSWRHITLDRQRQRQLAITASTVAASSGEELMAADRLAVIGATSFA